MTRVIGVGLAVAALLAVSACSSGDVRVAAGDQARTAANGNGATLSVRQVLEGGVFTEGSHWFIAIKTSDGALVSQTEITEEEPKRASFDLAPGTYNLTSWQRPCEGSCPEGTGEIKKLGGLTASCESTVELGEADSVTALIYVRPGRQDCRIELNG